jgi:hypothetical protein
MPGTGHSFRLHMEPDTGVFKIEVGQSQLPIYSLIKSLGASDSDINKAWGPDIAQINAQKAEPWLLKKIFDRLADRNAKTQFHGNIEAGLRHVFSKAQVDPEVSQRNLGHPSTAQSTRTPFCVQRRS